MNFFDMKAPNLSLVSLTQNILPFNSGHSHHFCLPLHDGLLWNWPISFPSVSFFDSSPHSIYFSAFVPFRSFLSLWHMNTLNFKSEALMRIDLHSLGLLMIGLRNSFSIFHSFSLSSSR